MDWAAMATGSYARLLIPIPRPWHRDRGGQATTFAWSMLGRTLWAHKLFLACLMLSVVALTSLHVSQAPPLFEAETLVLLGERKGAAEAGASLAAPAGQQGPESEALAFRSQVMAERLVDTLSLHLLPEFNPTLRTGPAGLRDWFDPARLVPNSLFNRLPAAVREALSARSVLSDQQQAASLRAEVAARALEHIAAEPADRPSVIRVRFVSTDPRLAALGANTLADLYLADRLAAKQAVSSRAQAFLRDEIARLRAAIAEATLQSLAAQATPSGGAGSGFGAAAGVRQADRDLLATYSARLQEIDLLLEGQEAGARIISVATMPDEPVNPRRKLTFGVALFGALLVGSLAALGLERLDNTISSAEQVRHLGLSALGALPTIPAARDRRRAPDRHLLDDPTGTFAQAVAALRKELVRANVVSRRTSVLLASALADEGTTTTALCLARAHARTGGRALLIDCDLRKPRLHELTGADNQHGLTGILLGDCTLDQVRHLDERSGALLVTAGPGVPDPQQLLVSEAMRRLMRQAAEHYDLVILDGPPVLGDQDACVLAQTADCTVLVARWGSTHRQDVAAAAGRLIEAGADMAGLVLTRVRPGRAAES
jgi:capsular exopolysaccharide synthesis family protein